MRQVVTTLRAAPRLADVPVPSTRSLGLLVRVSHSAISVGTERATAISADQGLIAKARSKPDKVGQVLQSVRQNGLDKTLATVNDALDKWTPLGYSCAGIVVETGSEVAEFRVGDRVACGGSGLASHADFCYLPRRLAVRVPDSVPLDQASMATIGAIALQGIRQADLRLGESLLVIGLGIVGQLACQLASAAGCRVVAMDVNQERVNLAVSLGASSGIVAGSDDESGVVRRFTDGFGVDAVLLTAATSSNEPVRTAARLCRDRGRIVVVGDVGLGIERQSVYEKELDIRMSRSYGPGRYDPSYEERGVDYPIGYVRWTEQRNIQAFIDLLAAKRLNVEALISHRFSIDQAADAYRLITGPSGANALGVILEYQPESQAVSRRSPLPAAPLRVSRDRLQIGFIGAGAFARGTLLPALKEQPVSPVGICTAGGLTAAEVGSKYGFEYAATDPREILNDSRVDTLFVATRHNTHARYVIDALRAGKNVFVEKPLAVTMEELEQVAAIQCETGLRVMVGFNRRFAPFIVKCLAAFGPNAGPKMINIRVNAGRMSQHWSQSADEGGGRIIGEGCHFVDLARFIAGSPITSVFARSLRPSGDALEESVAATLEFENGSLANLSYHAVGSSRVEKEYVEVFADGRAAIIDDFRSLRLADEAGSRIARARQDKGHGAELQAFVRSLLQAEPEPIPFEQAVESTLATLAILESCRSGSPVDPRRPFGNAQR